VAGALELEAEMPADGEPASVLRFDSSEIATTSAAVTTTLTT
jgi:hypothetical protein